MRNQGSSFTVLPWRKTETEEYFTPNRSKFFVSMGHGIYIAWRDDLVVILTFSCSSFEGLSSHKPLTSQVISSSHSILDVLETGKCIFFVSTNGLFQILTPDESTCFGKTLDYLGSSYNFSLKDAFELSPLKSILAVTAVPNEELSPSRHIFTVITCSKGCGNIDAEVYSLSFNSSQIDHHLEFVCHVDYKCLSKIVKCACSFLTSYQATNLFSDLKDAEILLVALSTGHLFCIPFFISNPNNGIKLSARLVYQSQWSIDGLRCPPDGLSIFLFLESGIVLNISANTGKLSNVPKRSLCYNTFSLPGSIKHFAAPKCNQLIVSDGIATNAVHLVSHEQIDIEVIPVKGVTALCEIPETNLVAASSLHGEYYLLDASNLIQSKDQELASFTGCNLDVSLQLVEEMKKQTELLSHYRKESEQEDSIIKALSQVARASLLSKCFKLTVKVIRTIEGNGRDKDDDQSMILVDTQQMYQISVDIRNNSAEHFDPSLWKISLEMRNPDGVIMTKNAALSKSLNQEFPFSSVINVPFLAGNLAFPILVNASLVAEIMEDNLESHWLKISVDSFELNISHFFSISFQPPQILMKSRPDLAIVFDEIKLQSHEHQNTEAIEQAMTTSYVIPVPEALRQPKLIIKKLLHNCEHRHNFSLEIDTNNQGDKTVMWIQVFQNVVQLIFRKSCAAITLCSSNLEVLHAVKLWLASELSVTDPLKDPSSYSVPGLAKAKNLNAVLETLPFEETCNSQQLLTIHQDLRNNVSSQIY